MRELAGKRLGLEIVHTHERGRRDSKAIGEGGLRIVPAARGPLPLVWGAGSLLPRKQDIGLRGQAPLQTRVHRLLHRRGGFERGARRADPSATRVQSEVGPGYGEGYLLQLAVEREVGAKELLAAALDAGATTAEVEQDPVELELWIDARAFGRERPARRHVSFPRGTAAGHRKQGGVVRR